MRENAAQEQILAQLGARTELLWMCPMPCNPAMVHCHDVSIS